ncbi:MAG: cytochrome P450, partial [Actinomycetota bacterium]|nr:cytochrome P450 [Actinomycetota bacterium]
LAMWRDPLRAEEAAVFQRRLTEGAVEGMPRGETTSILMLDNPDHARIRQPLSQALYARVAKSRADVERIVDTALDRLQDQPTFDLMPEFCVPIPIDVIASILGVDHERLGEFRDWSEGVIQSLNPFRDAAQTAHMERARDALTAYFIETLAERRANPRDDLFSDMMRTPVNGKLLTDDELRNFALLVLLGGMDTTAGVTGNSLLLIDKDPALRQQLIDNVEQMPKIIEEFLRIAGPGGGLYRRVMRDTEFHGEQLKEGEKVLMMFWAASRDPKAFADPEKIDIFREENRHMAFGLGPHRCLGSHHARMMFSTMMTAIFTRFPDFQVQWDGVERFEDCGSVYAVRHLPVTFTPGTRLTPH